MNIFGRSNAQRKRRFDGSIGRAAAVAAMGLLLATGSASAESKVPVARLKAEADQVWQLNERGHVVEASNRSAALVLAADALRDAGKLDEAKEYFRRAGLLRPWDLDTKLHQADVLARLGDAAGAAAVAKRVSKYAERDRLIEGARQFTHEAEPPKLPTLPELQPAAQEVVLGLVATPETEQWLLQAVGRRLAESLSLRVAVAAADFQVGRCNRTGRAQIAKELRQSLPWDDPRMAMNLPSGNRIRQETLSDDQVIEVMKVFLKREAMPQQLQAFLAQIAEADKTQQWADSPLLSALHDRFPQASPGRVVYVALVPVDLFSGNGNFLFGSALSEGNYAVVSYRRFAAAFTGEPPKGTRLVERTYKQMLSSIGFALGVVRCADAGCARSYPQSLAEHDAKDAELCGECRAGFARALGHELPVAKRSE